jgi:hypothetical protein
VLDSAEHSSGCKPTGLQPEAYWRQKFGHLVMKDPRPIHIGSSKKIVWVCDCGREKYIQVYKVTNGQQTCGKCEIRSKQFWEETKFGSLMMAEPSEFHFKSNKKTKLLIEYNGLRWHSQFNSKKYDSDKYRLAVSEGFNYLMIFEDEWIKNQDSIKNVILGKLNLGQLISLDECNTRIFQDDKIKEFNICFEFRYQGMLISSACFKRVQSDEMWECSWSVNNKFQISNNFNLILDQFISDYNPKQISAYSDNRFDNGEAFQEAGFKHICDIEPYFWFVFGQNRLISDSSGKCKIWDLGKKYWIKSINKF